MKSIKILQNSYTCKNRSKISTWVTESEAFSCILVFFSCLYFREREGGKFFINDVYLEFVRNFTIHYI